MRSDLLEQRRSNPNTRLIRTATKYRDDFVPIQKTFYDLRMIHNDLIGKKVNYVDGDQLIGNKVCTIVEVYPKMVRAAYRGGTNNEATFYTCFSIADLVARGIVSCKTGYCTMAKEVN